MSLAVAAVAAAAAAAVVWVAHNHRGVWAWALAHHRCLLRQQLCTTSLRCPGKALVAQPQRVASGTIPRLSQSWVAAQAVVSVVSVT
jgi:hypothetical protein